MVAQLVEGLKQNEALRKQGMRMASTQLRGPAASKWQAAVDECLTALKEVDQASKPFLQRKGKTAFRA